MTTGSEGLLEVALTLTRSVLEPDGWEVHGRLTPTALILDLHHPLSEYGFGIAHPQAGSVPTKIERFLATDPELDLVRRGPRLPGHGVTVRGLRNAACNYGWSSGIVGEVAGSLVELQILDQEEAEWLQDAATHDRLMQPPENG